MNLQPSRVLFEQDIRRPNLAIKPIGTTQIQTTATTVYTAGPTYDFMIRHLWAANVTAGAIALSVYMVPASGTAGTSNACMVGVSIAANTTVRLECLAGWTYGSLLQPGMSLQALCGTNDAINIGGWGIDLLGAEI